MKRRHMYVASSFITSMSSSGVLSVVNLYRRYSWNSIFFMPIALESTYGDSFLLYVLTSGLTLIVTIDKKDEAHGYEGVIQGKSDAATVLFAILYRE